MTAPKKMGNGLATLFREPFDALTLGLFIPLNGKMRKALDQLAASGMFTGTASEIAAEMVLAGIRDAVAAGLIPKPTRASAKSKGRQR